MSNCQYPSTCVNTLGSYYCRCDQAGYRMGNDTMTCVDVDECLRPEVHACSQQCHNTLGSYYCGCNEGYTLSANAKQCIDIDECLSNRGGCSQSCQNTPGSFECYCNRGFKMNPNDNTTCLDEDECALLTEETCPRCRPTKDNW
jgi:fibulin 1/2